MNEELKEELSAGNHAALAFAAHARRMNCDMCQRDIIIEDELYVVTCQHKPVNEPQPKQENNWLSTAKGTLIRVGVAIS